MVYKVSYHFVAHAHLLKSAKGQGREFSHYASLVCRTLPRSCGQKIALFTIFRPEYFCCSQFLAALRRQRAAAVNQTFRSLCQKLSRVALIAKPSAKVLKKGRIRFHNNRKLTYVFY